VQERPPFVPSRGEAYLGVLVDDMVLKGTSEPYRMFTSRAEYRLLLDIDSADLRLTGHGFEIGLIPEERHARFLERKERVERYTEALRATAITPTPGTVRRIEAALGIRLAEPTTPARLLRRRDVSLEALERYLSLERKTGDEAPPRLTVRERRLIENRMRYGGYLERQERDVERMRREEGRRIPERFDFAGIPGLSREIVEKLSRSRPETLAQAARISGVTPAALSLINVYLEKARRAGATSGTCP